MLMISLQIFLQVAPCRLLKSYLCFEAGLCLYLQGQAA